jgi:hypothetical protein
MIEQINRRTSVGETTMRQRVCGSLIGLSLLISVCACVSLSSPHQRFIDWADGEVAGVNALEDLNFDPRYPRGAYLADERFLVSTETRPDGRLMYHFARPTLRLNMICHYHLVVEPASMLVIDWGFDAGFGDPERVCRVAG